MIDHDLDARILTYGELEASSRRLAAALRDLGIGPGDRVATWLGKSSELLVAVLATWRLGAVYVPLFTAFAAPAVRTRLRDSGTKVLICDDTQRRKLTTEALPDNTTVVVAGDPTHPDDVSFTDLIDSTQPLATSYRDKPDDPLIQIFTSGTTGTPKGVLVPKRALAAFHAYMEFGLDVRRDDVFWNAADPGWGYGLYFGIIGSFCSRVPSVLVQGGFSVERTYEVLSRLRVTNFAAAPTVYRALRSSTAPIPRDLAIRAASAAGEPLTPEVNQWAVRALGVAVHDHYGQTELGMVINNHHHPELRKPLRKGSMGHPMPGWTAAILEMDGDTVAPPGTLGRIAFDLQRSPLAWFTGYERAPEKTAEKHSADGRWYLTGDTGYVDGDGYFHFQSRDDDVIIMAGYRIGPFDIESVLVTHPAVAEAAVIAAPDPLKGEVLEAYVVPRDDLRDPAQLTRDLQQLVKTKYAAHAYPRQVHFVSELPKTPSGKIQRYVLRKRRVEQTEGVVS
ncbi:AMP-binding protein [Prauserella shujinwangii]|uniref:AMP-binding protein n=1 Tax=Prauserella shujinwangii TaxID=1453103 RepID=UPI001FEB036A|nr:AMP-binding protein [Prauserella shujinwangii]